MFIFSKLQMILFTGKRVFGSWELISVVRVKTEIRFKKQWLQPHPKTTLKECGRIYYTFSSTFINTNSFYVELNFRNALAASTRGASMYNAKNLNFRKFCGKKSPLEKIPVCLCVGIINGNLSGMECERPFEFLKGPIITEEKDRLTEQMVYFTW